jgi:hypothetical protein
VMPPSGNKGNSKCSRQKASLTQCSYYMMLIYSIFSSIESESS